MPSDQRTRQDELRSIIDQYLWVIRIYSGTGHDYVELGDDIGLDYTIRMLLIAIKGARDTLAILKLTHAPQPVTIEATSSENPA